MTIFSKRLSEAVDARPRGSGIGSSKRALPPAIRHQAPIMRHALAAIEAAIFFGRPIPIVSPFLNIGLGALRQEHAPGGFEVGPLDTLGLKLIAVVDEAALERNRSRLVPRNESQVRTRQCRRASVSHARLA